jgi:uncharacterized DUF497 family protein
MEENVLTTYTRDGRLHFSDVVHEQNGIRFVWDGEKAESNRRKHGVPFEAACEVFFDPFVHLLGSNMIGGEDRESAIGLTQGWSPVVVVYTFREEAIRVISARPATARERNFYEGTTAP